ncbi:MAG: hypothetical protein ALAOOOJD_04235 [bacterium]|nr:hypothetical protein [bacterium]
MNIVLFPCAIISKFYSNFCRLVSMHIKYRLVSCRMLLSAILFFLSPLSAQEKPYRGAEYRTKASYKYGRFEVRMKSAAGNGILTSFFTYHDPSPFSTANWNEIDIETLGRYTNETQFNTITPGRIDHVQRQVIKFNPHLSFHVYAIEWTPDYVAWRVDGYEVYRQTASHINTLNREQKIMMNIWQPNSVNWGGPFDPAGLPFHGFYDWVKYSAYTPGVGDNFTLQWTDNFDSWDQSRWDRATHTFDGNNAQFLADNAAFRNGYLILCLTSPSATGYRGGVVVDLDLDPPYLVWARAEEKRFIAFFSEELEQASAETISNYTIAGVTIHSATLLPGNKSVALQTDSLDLKQSYLLVATGLKDRSPSQWQMRLQYTNVINALPFPININVAGQAEAGFLPDQTWDAYKKYGAVGGIEKSRPAGTTITGTNAPAIYQTEREALSFYQVRVPSGKYRITLMLADSDHDRAGQRVFDIYGEGQLLFDNVDIVAEVGKNVALEKMISDFAVTDGQLDIYFKPETGTATLSGLKIERILATGIEMNKVLPQRFGLEIFPNPFNPAAKIAYSLNRRGRVDIDLFNGNGQLIKNMLSAEQQAGSHTLTLEADDLSAGVYWVRLLLDGQMLMAKKALYLK